MSHVKDLFGDIQGVHVPNSKLEKFKGEEKIKLRENHQS